MTTDWNGKADPSEWTPKGLAMLVVGLAACSMVLGFGFVFFLKDLSSGDADARSHNQFMRSCLEFHTKDRCSDFDFYDRRDLGLKPENGRVLLGDR